MNEPGGATPGEWAAFVTAIGVAAGATFKGLGLLGRWYSDWADRRAQRRDEKLAAWHDELAKERAALAAERAELRAEMHDQLTVFREEIGWLRRQNSALRNAFELMAAPVRAVTPDDARLVQAEKILAHAFEIDPLAPVDFAKPLKGLAAIPGGEPAPRFATDGKEV